MLPLCPVTLLNSFISSHSFLVTSLGFSVFADSFASYFPIWMLLISFSGLIALVITSRTVLCRKCEIVHLVFFLILGGKCYLSTLVMMFSLCVFFLQHLIKLRKFFSMPSLLMVLSQKGVGASVLEVSWSEGEQGPVFLSCYTWNRVSTLQL